MAANPMAANPMAANPMAAMMQQMMGNPAQMQQAMNMSQQLLGGGGFGGPPFQQLPAANAAATAGSSPEMLRARFQSQLSQLMAMGFSNETACLQVLAQHNGRIDAAIDALLSMGPDAA
mmetsp:Transcript_25058/g.37666  ORF Transcript_25058/g.37666 Transcript_25058/m.37666 type:complete len:119 (-) Transcript_25058:352-708(-)